MRLQQSQKHVTLTFDLPPGVNAADLSVVAEARAVRITMGSGAPFAFPLPGGCSIQPDGTRFEVDERSVPRHLVVVLEKAPETWWPLDEERSPRSSTGGPAATVPLPAITPSAPPPSATQSAAVEEPQHSNFDAFDMALGFHRRARAMFWRAFVWSPWFSENWFSVLIYAIFGVALLSYLNEVWLDDQRTWSVALFAFQKDLGLVFIGAWISAGWQVVGLIGERGIVPLRDTLATMDADAPTLFRWASWAPTDRNLRMHVVLGLLSASLFTLNVAPSLSMLACLLLYMSLRVCGSVFFQLQFDSLLLETGWLAVLCFASPVHWVCIVGGALTVRV